ncbi:MAG: hypothetical protein GSR85_00745 [Desulfurococcales archaeon]|nr:hypothetical protein [Desulfurococcales archaeon]
MVKRLGAKWFEMRDEWLLKAWEANREMWGETKYTGSPYKGHTCQRQG